MTPEAKARSLIDAKLEAAGWAIQDMKQLNLGAALGVAVREYTTDTGPADYVLFVNRNAIGVIEAKKDSAGENLTVTETQTERYANATLKWRKDNAPLRFLFEATGQIIRFTDGADPAPRSREVFHFFKPETLATRFAQPNTLRRRLAEQIPALPERNLRDCQISAVTGLEKSLALNKPRALVHMATGAGKTFTAITSVYRLLKFGGAKRILFLVDTRNLGKQAHQEFMAYTPPDDARKFTELYNVQRLASPHIDPHAQVCISTIQRMYSILSGEPIDDSAEDISLNEVLQTAGQSKLVRYNPTVPVETFDFIVIDECHRSIYNLWKQVLDYFDAFLIGLTATPDRRTFGFFNENIVAEYSYEQSVADGVNVGYDVWEIETDITRIGAALKAREWVDHRDRQTRKKRWAQTEDDTAYTGKELDRSVVNPSQIRQVILAMKTAVETQIFPTRKETPKTLIFAKTDSHADDIINIVREVYGQGNAFCKKVTYRAEEDADSILASFRNDYHPRIAVTVDMIATGTDVKPLEVLIFMRDVKSELYFEQMKGRGARTISTDKLREVTPDAEAKTRFVLIDAVGVSESLKTISQPLERNRAISFDRLIDEVAAGRRDDDAFATLAGRLAALDRRIGDKDRAAIVKASGGIDLPGLAARLLDAIDPDVLAARTPKEAPEPEQKKARDAIKDEAATLLDDPALRRLLKEVKAAADIRIDTISTDAVVSSGWDEKKATDTVDKFKRFLDERRNELTALQILYRLPYAQRRLTYEAVDELKEALKRPPWLLEPPDIWRAYKRLASDKVRGNPAGTLADIVMLVRYAIGQTESLEPLPALIAGRFNLWLGREEKAGRSYSDEQRNWLLAIRDHLAVNIELRPEDMMDAPEFAGRGGIIRARALFGARLPALLDELTDTLVA
jgi:type I restriction enzyme R subunit